MKQFIKDIFSFFLIPFVILGILVSFVFYISKSINYKFKQNIKEVYIGDSHLASAVMDSLLLSSKNVSISSESFYFSYFKLRKLLLENRGVERVYLGFSYHNLSNYYDDFIVGKYSLIISPKYFYLLPAGEKFKLIQWNVNNLPVFMEGVWDISYSYLFKDVSYNYGGYNNIYTKTVAVKSSMDKRLRFQYYTDNKLDKFSDINLNYLTKIISLCKMNKIDLIILNTPLHPYFKKNIPQLYIQKFNEMLSKYKLNVKDLSYLSFSDSSFIPDGDHLSVEGAYQFTKELRRIKLEDTHE